MTDVNIKGNWATLLLVLGIVVALFLMLRAQTIAHRNGLRADSLEVVADSTRLTAEGYQRRMLQTQLRAESLEQRLRLTPTVRIVPVIHVDTVTDTVHAPVIGDSIREADFRVRQMPYTLLAHVALPPPPSEGRLAVSVALDAITVGVRVGCGEAVGGIRPAQATVTLPPWAKAELTEVIGDPDVCNARTVNVTGGMPWWLAGMAALLGLSFGISLW